MSGVIQRILTASVFLTMLQIASIAQHTIDFSKSTNLKAIYDAGLRPWHAWKDTMTSLAITDENIRIILPDAQPFEITIESCGLSVMAGNDLSVANFISDYESLSAAADKARKICRALGISTEDLDYKVEVFARQGIDSASPQYWTAHTTKRNCQVQVTFRPYFGLLETLGRVYVILNFHDASKPMKLLKEPIKPPPGYENVSMKPPPLKSKPKPFPATNRSFFSNWMWLVGAAILALLAVLLWKRSGGFSSDD